MEIVQELPLDEAIEKARKFLAGQPMVIWPTELAGAIGTSVTQAVEVCEILAASGELAVAQ